MLEVHADVYNLNMHMFSQIRHEGLTINKLPNYRQIVNVHGSLDRHAVTADAKIDVPAHLTKPEDMANYAKDFVLPYSRLISFAQDHDVFFQNFRVYEIENSSKKTLYSVSYSMHVGKPWGATNVYTLDEFLSVAIPLLKNENFNAKTGLNWALILHNEGLALNVLEQELTLFFVGLETLANAYWSNLPSSDRKPWLFDDQTWSVIRKTVKNKIDELKIDDPERNSFLGRFGNLKNPPIEEKINLLCMAYGLPDYSKQIAAMNDMRNDILHGKPVAQKYGEFEYVSVRVICERLLVKLLLKLLNFYRPWADVHASLTETDDLTAVS